MATTKSKKKRIREKNLESHYNQIRLNRVLKALGVTDLHRNLHADFREAILKNPDPPLLLECPDGPVLEMLRRCVKEWSNISYNGISASDFAEVMFPLVRHVSSAVGYEVMAGCAENGLKKVTKEFFLKYATPGDEFLNYFTYKLIEAIQLGVLAETAPDRQYVKTEFGIDRLLRIRVRFKITASIIQPQRIWVGGTWRYRVGTYYGKSFTSLPEISWLSRCPLDYGLPGTADENLPVYISSHALDRIRGRVDDQWMMMVAMSAIYPAMDNPVYYPLQGNSGNMLVELRVKNTDVKLGYFVVSRTRSEITIKTFLFCTMSQTPEGYKLHRRLRMTRPDYDFHKLENYSTFANSDITTHPKLQPIWDECGFGGLLELIDSGAKMFDLKQKPIAEEIIHYFKLEGG